MRGRQGHSYRAVVREAAVVAVFGLIVGAGPSFGATVETGSDGGGSTNGDPSNWTTVWNPVNPCAWVEGETLSQLLSCLGTYIDPTWACRLPNDGSGIQLPPGYKQFIVVDPTYCPTPDTRGEFRVTYLSPPKIGIQIVRRVADATGSYEPAMMKLIEDSHTINVTAVSVNRPGLSAYIHELEGVPAGGVVQLTINKIAVPAVNTTAGSSLANLNQQLVSNLESAGFNAEYEPPYIILMPVGPNITRVSLRSTDPGIYKSEIALVPQATPPADY